MSTYDEREWIRKIEERAYKHGAGFMASCPQCGHRKRMIDIRGQWWFLCPCGYQYSAGRIANVRELISKQPA